MHQQNATRQTDARNGLGSAADDQRPGAPRETVRSDLSTNMADVITRRPLALEGSLIHDFDSTRIGLGG